MLRTGCADDHGVTEFALQLAVMRQPAECHLSKCQIVFLADRAKYFQGLEVGVVPVTPSVRLALPVLGVKAQPRPAASLSGVYFPVKNPPPTE